ncbi:MAG: endo alpha-1,4 polygalactosaminidase [Planctomycetes bacterium]|nr:endo alpha-1,4 polygalactosaminidase [Planctomycetota bacterium]
MLPTRDKPRPTRAILGLCLALAAGCKAPAAPAAAAPTPAVRPSLDAVRDWAILLNPPRTVRADHPAFQAFDLVVLDPDSIDRSGGGLDGGPRMSPPTPAAPPAARPLRVGYLSLGEAESYRPYWAAQAGASWILEDNPDWPDNHRVDVRAAAWARVLLADEAPRVLGLGFQGLFLDTLDVAEGLESRGLAGSRAAMLDLVRSLRERHPEAVLLANGGLALLPELASLVDGVVLEDLYHAWDFERGRSVKVAAEARWERLQALAAHPGLPLFSVDYTEDPAESREAAREARRAGVRPYVAPVALDRLRTDALPGRRPPGGEPRGVLVLYDSTELGEEEEVRRPLRAAEMALNHLGCTVRWHDVAGGLPPDEALAGVRGVLTWFFDDRMGGAEAYCRWLRARLREDLRVLVLGELGAFRDTEGDRETPPELLESLYREMGLELGPDWPSRPPSRRVVVEHKEPEWVEFERDLEGEVGSYLEVHAADPRCRTLLTLGRTDRPGARADAVVLTPTGGYAQDGYVFYRAPEVYTCQWRIDPFRLFEAAFGLAGLPRPDVTTQNGRRVWFSHVDGDGLMNLSFDGGRYCGDVILERVLRAYPLPFTVSVITSTVDPASLGSPQALALARSIFALPHVEPASHGHAHPQDWERHELTTPVPGYSYDEHTEVVASSNYIRESLLAPGGRVGLFLWTGNCNPTESALRLAREAGLLNMNGGDSRLDEALPSYAYVAPLTRRVGSEVQVHAGAPNENVYTHGFTEPLFGFRNVLATFRNTERASVLWSGLAPARRVTPLDVYFHFYSAAERAALEALLHVLEESSRGEVAPVHAGEYVLKVEGFLGARLERLSDEVWRVSDYGECRTLRLDDGLRVPDPARSAGLLGWRREEGRLYVHLAGGDEAVLALAPAAADAPEGGPPRLEQAACRVDRLEAGPSGLSLRTSGVGAGELVLAGLEPGRDYGLWLAGAAQARLHVERASGEGRLALRVPAGEYLLRAEE